MTGGGFLRQIGRRPAMRRLGRHIEHTAKPLLNRLLDRLLPAPPNEPLAAIATPRRVLLVRPNFRLGNTLIATPLVPALRSRFPGAELDYLGTDATAPLLEHLPLTRLHCLSRRFILRPWGLVRLLARLRRLRYDVAVDAGMGSVSSGLYTWLSGAPHRIGIDGPGARFLTTRLSAPPVVHAYDAPAALAGALGAPCADRPVYVVTDDERGAALRLLEPLGLLTAGGPPRRPLPFVAVSVSGHKDKQLPAQLWIDLVTRLVAAGRRVLVLPGPEERAALPRLRGAMTGAAVLEPQPVRVFGALLALARVVVAPDSGPLHLAVAVGTPAVALLAAPASRRYAPRGPHDRVVFPATAAAAAAAVLGHGCWPAGAA